jgi:hypothetical protein
MIDTETSKTAGQVNDEGPVGGDGDETRNERGKVWEIRRKVKVSNNRSSLFNFIFSEYRKIRNFGQDTHILYPKLFPPGIQLNRDVHAPFTKYLQPCAIELYKAVTHVLKKRWSQLEKEEYNLLVILRRLCEKLALTNFNLLNYGDRNLIDRLRIVETYFLALHSDPGYPEMIVAALSRVLANDVQYRKKLPVLAASVRKILEKNIETPSLYNFILGLNMLKYRRSFRLKDLIAGNCGDIMGGALLECEQDIRREINGFIEECRKKITALARKKSDIGRIRRYLPADEDGEIDHSILQYLYESDEAQVGRNFVTDQEDVVRFTARLLRMFRDSFGNLLCGSIGLFGVGTVHIFPQDYFRIEFDKIETLIRQLEETSYNYTNPVDLQQYLALKVPQNQSSKHESEVLTIIDDALGLLHKIGKEIAQVLGEVQGEDGVPKRTRSSRQDVLTVPVETRISGKNSGFLGKSVGEVILFVVNICFLIDHVFHGRFTYVLLSKEAMIDNEINTKLAMLKRVADEKMYREVTHLVG